MTRRGSVRLRLAVGAAVTATLGATGLAAGPAAAAPTPSASACEHASSTARADGPWTRYRRDTGADVSAREAADVQRVLDQRSTGRAAASTGTIVIAVRAHVLRGTHRRDGHTTRPQVLRQIAQLNQAYAGGEAPGVATDTHIRFRLRSITSTVNDAWYHLSGPGRAANAMKRHLHQGKNFTLNLYFVDLAGADGLLGYTTFPWRYRVHPRLDGVVVAYNSVPGGKLHPYDQGDTAVHEVGHWLGLLHTFQGGCEGTGDGVADTPAEGEPQFQCDETADTCDSPGLDPVHNFMDYSLDTCMNQFTPGQADRMARAWAAYRQRR